MNAIYVKKTFQIETATLRCYDFRGHAMIWRF